MTPEPLLKVYARAHRLRLDSARRSAVTSELEIQGAHPSGGTRAFLALDGGRDLGDEPALVIVSICTLAIFARRRSLCQEIDMSFRRGFSLSRLR